METLTEKDIESFVLASEPTETVSADEPAPTEAADVNSSEPTEGPSLDSAPESVEEEADEPCRDEPPVAEQPAPETPALEPALGDRLEVLERKMDALSEAFAGKLRYDAAKQVIIDRQYAELESFKRAEFAKLSNAIIMDVIDEIDSAEKGTRYFAEQECTPENYEKLKKMLMGTAESLVDLLERNDVYSYRSEPGSAFDAKRQRVLRVVPTEDAAADRTIQESLRPGFERENRVLRPEMVAVYALRR